MNIQDKRKKLNEEIAKLTKKDVVIAFSGGVDSSLLLALFCQAAKQQGTKVYAVTFDTILHPRGDITIAKRVAAEMGAIYEVIPVNELAHPEIINNSRERCYYCKKTLFSELIAFGKARGIDAIIEGTNYDDLSQYRPGIKAVAELGIISPLKNAELTKDEVRSLATELGISVAQRPSAPCMATRLPYGTRLEPQLFVRIEQAEEFLKAKGFANVRVRVHDQIARVEVDPQQFDLLLKERTAIVETFKQLEFHYVTLDLEGFRSGSMDK